MSQSLPIGEQSLLPLDVNSSWYEPRERKQEGGLVGGIELIWVVVEKDLWWGVSQFYFFLDMINKK